MKNILLATIAAVVLVGCATNQQPTHEHEKPYVYPKKPRVREVPFTY